MMQEKYEQRGTSFWIIDPELEISIEGCFDESRFESTYKNNLLHGPSVYYSKSGQILSKTWFFEGKKVGKAHRFFLNGQLYSLERYIHGLYHLDQEYYHADGSLKSLIRYQNGVLHGETFLYWPDGTLKRKCSFSKGKKEADMFYDEGGNLIEDLQQSLS